MMTLRSFPRFDAASEWADEYKAVACPSDPVYVVEDFEPRAKIEARRFLVVLGDHVSNEQLPDGPRFEIQYKA